MSNIIKKTVFDSMEQGAETLIGNGGVRLSGGQAQRVALARTLCHKKPLLVLDDPFSVLDQYTEKEVFAHIREKAKDSVTLLISHRLYLFPRMDRIIWMGDGKTVVAAVIKSFCVCRKSAKIDTFFLQKTMVN